MRTLQIRVESAVPVFEPGPSAGHRHCCEPRLARLADGTLLLAHRLGSERLSPDGRIQLLRSRSGGRSWDALGRPFTPASFDGSGDVLLCVLAPIGAEGLAAVVGWMDWSDSGKPWRNHENEGRLPLAMFAARSADGGDTWSTLVPLNPSPYSQAVPQSMVATSSGRLLVTFETFKEYDDPKPWIYRAGCLISDGVAEWNGPARLCAEMAPDGTMWWDPRLTLLPDGRLVQFYHAFHYPTGSDLPIHVAWSADDGRTWTQPVSTGLRGQMSAPAALAQGGLLLLVQQRHEPRGLYAYLSHDSGKSFESSDGVPVYLHGADSLGAADGSITASQYFDDMNGFTFGHPAAVRLEDDSVLVAYYRGTRAATAIEAVRVRVEG